MNIDWFTFTAQIINFLVLIALLRWTLYDPIVRAMQTREKKIAKRLEEAEQKSAKAEHLSEEYRVKREQLEQDKESLLREAHRQVEQEKKTMLQEARQHVEQQRDDWLNAFRRDQNELARHLQHQTAELGIYAARRTLSQLADQSLEKRIVAGFLKQLENLEETQRNEIRDHLLDGITAIEVRSVFELDQEDRSALESAVHEAFGWDGELRFVLEPKLICGIELDVAGYSLGWNTRSFLHELEAEIAERLRNEQWQMRKVQK
jgi:F-type H+-transporting ATPase subunit b